MRITHVVRQFPPSVGGLEEAVLKLCGTLEGRGIATSVVTLDRIAQGGPTPLDPVDVVGGIPVRRIPFRGSWRYPVAPGVLSCVGGADLVHVHGIDFFFDFLATTRPLHGKPLVASTHGGFFHTAFAQRLKRLYFHTATRTAALAYRAVLASSQADLDLFRPVVSASRLRLAVNGVDTAKWGGLASRAPQRHMVYIGRFSSNKNVPALFPLLGALRRLHPDWRLTVAGQPSDVSAAALRQQAERLGVAQALTILEKPNDSAVAQAIATASTVVSPSRHEGFGLSIVEGMAAGLVPVLSDIPPFRTFIAEAGVGRIVDFDQAPTAATAIEDLHAELLAAPARVRAAVIQVAQRYSFDTAADAVQRCYAEVLRQPFATPVNASARISP